MKRENKEKIHGEKEGMEESERRMEKEERKERKVKKISTMEEINVRRGKWGGESEK